MKYFQTTKCFLLSLILISLPLLTSAQNNASSTPVTLQIVQEPIKVHGQPSFVYRIKQPDGTLGLRANKGDDLNIVVQNKIDQPSSIHWHGIILPSDQDGVPYVTQNPIMPGGSYSYHFKLTQAGTFWMHSHFRLQEQKLLAAPLIITDPNNQSSNQEVVILLEDFSFTSPRDIYKKLRCQGNTASSDMSKMSMPKVDINDVKYDAFLANEHTLSDPQVVRVTPGSIVRLRIINAAASTNFYIDLGSLKGEALAVDGNRIIPQSINPFQLGMAQRVDIQVSIPNKEGAYPILGRVEGSNDQTGIVLATSKAHLPTLKEQATNATSAFTNEQEQLFQAASPLAKKPVTKSIALELEGNMQKYIWKINNQIWPYITPPQVASGDRVELVFINQTSMSHPMHLHGHTFQVTNVNGKDIHGANRDTILVLPHSTVKVQFDANNPGVWLLHCHNLYHAASGMITKLLYNKYKAPAFSFLQQGSMSGAFLYTNPQECAAQ